MFEMNETRDAVEFALERARDMVSNVGVVGYGTAVLLDAHGNHKNVVPFWNKVTDVGDLFHAQAAAYVTRSAVGAPTAATGIQIGSATTAAAKNGAGAAIGTYIIGQAFDSGYPTTANLGAGLGVNVQYKVTYAAGVGTSTTINEAVVVNTTIGTAAAAAGTLQRVVFGSTINKGASDTLAVTWNVTFLGA
jgi:hypothetical protein